MSNKMRLRFAPSPTGALHIGGIRTALYNYLLAKKSGGDFILRIEDTDQGRYVNGAEEYIIEALQWCGLEPSEGLGFAGDLGPYRQSERRDIYQKYALELIKKGKAYYAFDSAESLADIRKKSESEGKSFKYGHQNRETLNNSLSISKGELHKRLQLSMPYTIRLKVEPDEIVIIEDLVRGQVKMSTDELDDKVMLKADGLPTYHLANIVDDHFMKISHVVRGEEWLSSTAHHILLYQAFGWEETMPKFAHLPLILKPTGKGKLSKRDGSKLGIPVFPLSWTLEDGESLDGFREYGFEPAAVINFLAFLGWNPGTEQEIYTLAELIEAFSVKKIGKSGARFDFEKAKWFNKQYVALAKNEYILERLRPYIKAKAYNGSDDYLLKVIELMKERVSFVKDIVEEGYYFFENVRSYEEKIVRKKYKNEVVSQFENLRIALAREGDYKSHKLEEFVKSWIVKNEAKVGSIFPLLRLAVSGVTGGPNIFEILEMLGKQEVNKRLIKGINDFDRIVEK